MLLNTTLLDGQLLALGTTSSPVADFAAPVRTGVLLTDGMELEIHAGPTSAADFFFETTGSTPGAPVRLRTGQDLRTGAYGARADQGLAFRIDVGGDALFGVAPPTMTRETLAAALSSARPDRGRRGLRLRPTGAVEWSPLRSLDLAVSAGDGSGHSVLLDVRRAFRPAPRGNGGQRVRGGWLSRSSPSERVHLVLETDDVVVYGIPPTESDLDLAVEVLADLEIVLEDPPRDGAPGVDESSDVDGSSQGDGPSQGEASPDVGTVDDSGDADPERELP